ncbi:hypothetical protein GH714_021940 [Hevea brasiliensis]|uniref:Uncharacterized protein n=1 Tax=Hevea brasiliensis TaxID=3981 RepID=A0A6A6LA81_HEVBR|nr:hypothetical protein GH714_021940 [Hevea brasiliensis]
MGFPKTHLLVAFVFLFFSIVTSARVSRSGPSPGLSPDPPVHKTIENFIADNLKPPSGPSHGKSPGEPPLKTGTRKYHINNKPPSGPNPRGSPGEPPLKTGTRKYHINNKPPSGPNPRGSPGEPPHPMVRTSPSFPFENVKSALSSVHRFLWEPNRLVPSGPNGEQSSDAPPHIGDFQILQLEGFE